MAALNQAFDANNVQPNTGFDLLTPGDYPAMIVKSEMKDTSTGGQMLVLEMEVTDGPSKSRRLWDRLNLVNKSAKAVEIANQTLSAICHATGKMSIADSDVLHFIPMTVKVVVEPAVGQYAAKNAVKGYSKLGGGTSSPMSAARPAAQPVGASAPSAPRSAPWAKRAVA